MRYFHFLGTPHLGSTFYECSSSYITLPHAKDYFRKNTKYLFEYFVRCVVADIGSGSGRDLGGVDLLAPLLKRSQPQLGCLGCNGFPAGPRIRTRAATPLRHGRRSGPPVNLMFASQLVLRARPSVPMWISFPCENDAGSWVGNRAMIVFISEYVG